MAHLGKKQRGGLAVGYLLLEVLVASVWLTSTWAAQLPVQEFFRNPTVSLFQVSPSGAQLAYLKPVDGRMNIFVRSLTGGTERAVTHVTDRDLTQFFWKGENTLVFLKDDGGDENYHLFKVDLATDTATDLTPYSKTRVEIVDNYEHLKDSELLVGHNQRDPKIFDLYRVNLKTNKLSLLLKNPGDFTDFQTDHLGRVRTVSRVVGTQTEILFRETENAPFKTVLTYDFQFAFSPVAFTADNRNILALTNLEHDKTSLVEFDPRTKKTVRLIYQHPENDLTGILWSEKNHSLAGVQVETWKTDYAFFNSAWENAFQKVHDQVGTANLALLSKTKDESKMTFLAYSDRQRGTFYLYDFKTASLEKLGEAAPWMKPETLSEVRPIQFISRDGLTINGYVALPLGTKPGERVPFVVSPHGGPWARDTWRFNPELQFLANRGFGVLKLNYRGSTGYGRKFWSASFKQWGLKMQDDITDGTNWLVQQGLADGRKICIYGGSYGGYATLMGLVKEPNLYSCGVDYVGVSNLFTFMKTIPPYWEIELQKMFAMVGDPTKDKAQFEATSPVLQAKKIKAPLFVAQGARDPRVNKAESDQMVAALKARGIEVPYMVKDNEGHGFRNEENKFEFYSEMEKFLKKHLR